MDVAGVMVITVTGVLFLVLPFLAYLIGRAVSPPIDYPTKLERFESGNLPSGRGRGYFLMQYYPYLLLFIAMESYIVLVLFIALSSIAGVIVNSLILILLSALLIIPSFVYALRKAGVIDLWRAD
ncbi:MAG: NADH-quinone oxidoreductase subunit A [Desulfurococcales archaeon]|jgi:NADH-quinone oxidoreductase subunit A